MKSTKENKLYKNNYNRKKNDSGSNQGTIRVTIVEYTEHYLFYGVRNYAEPDNMPIRNII